MTHQLLDSAVTLLIGFSVFGLLILAVAYALFLPGAQRSRVSLAACMVLTGALLGLQLFHFEALATGRDLFGVPAYRTLLLIAPPAFYFFSRALLFPHKRVSWVDLAHWAPVACAVALPPRVVVPVAFLIGATYSVWLAMVVVSMRRQARRFKFELFFFALFAVLAVCVLLLVLLLPWLNAGLFFAAYAIAIGIGVVLVLFVVLAFPNILNDVEEAARSAYVATTLRGVDTAALVAEINRLFEQERIHRNESFNLTLLSEQLELTTHQVSELINANMGCGFSKLVRQHRVADAKRLLQEDDRSSVLSIGLTVGFGSQSSFYAAFREIVGQSPAKYRTRTTVQDKLAD